MPKLPPKLKILLDSHGRAVGVEVAGQAIGGISHIQVDHEPRSLPTVTITVACEVEYVSHHKPVEGSR
jgi:glycerate kinase